MRSATTGRLVGRRRGLAATRLLPLLIGLLSGGLLGPANTGLAQAKAEVDEALEELRASDREWRENDSEFRRLRQHQPMREDTVSEYAEFVALLHRKMLENCQRFRTVGGDPDLLGFTCKLPKQDLSHGKGLPRDPAQVMTDREKTASLETLLKESAHAFDKTLYERQEKLRADGANQASGSGAGSRTGRLDSASDRSRSGGSPGGRSSGTRSEAAEPPSPSDGARRVGPPLADPGAGPGMERAAALRNPSLNASGGNDDDVVARQLREAAEREQDPVMKEKLWDEYRKYKAAKN